MPVDHQPLFIGSNGLLGKTKSFIPGVFFGDEKMLAEMAETQAAGKVIGGHYASLDLGLPFHGYVAGGPEDDHESTRLEDAVARVRQGMKVMMRLGSAWHDVEEQVKAVTEQGLDSRHFILCTDDSHSETLVEDGHMDRVVRHAIEHGLTPIKAIQMATINTAEHFGVDKDMGMIAPGRYADILFVPDLASFEVEAVYAKGQRIATKGILTIDIPAFPYPEWATKSVNLGKNLDASDFRLASPVEDGGVAANVIGVVENQAPASATKITRARPNASSAWPCSRYGCIALRNDCCSTMATAESPRMNGVCIVSRSSSEPSA